MSIEDAIHSIGIGAYYNEDNKSRKRMLKSLLEVGISLSDGKRLIREYEYKYHVPVISIGYKCPNCGKEVVPNQKKCSCLCCENRLIWKHRFEKEV